MNEPTPTRPTTVPLVRQATVSDIDLLVPLFDGYRQFYRQASEPDRIRRFLLDRFEHNQSVSFVAAKDRAPIGFTQLYPSFSSGALARIYVLNDISWILGPAAQEQAQRFWRLLRTMRGAWVQ